MRSTSDVELVISQALTLRDQDRPEAAIADVKAALATSPPASKARLWHVLALLYRAGGDGPRAAQAFVEASKYAPRDAKIALGAAQTSLEAGFPALALFERALSLAPTDGDVLIGRAAAQIAEGVPAQAIADLELVLANNPRWCAGHLTLAKIKHMFGVSNDVASFERALASAPVEVSLWISYLELLMATQRYARAEEIIDRGRVALNDPDAFDGFEAVCASEQGDASRADRLFARNRHSPNVTLVSHHVRHLLRTGRERVAADLMEPWLTDRGADELWPYASLVWRLTGDHRWRWLEDERLVGVFDLGLRDDELSDLAGVLRRLHLTNGAPLGQSVRGGTQTDGPLFMRHEPQILALRARIRVAIEEHVRNLPLNAHHPTLAKRPHSLRFAGSWSVRLAGATSGHHTNHIHPRGWYSSAFYVSVPPASQAGEPPAGWLSLGEPPIELGLRLTSLRMIEPKPGRLVLFPSIMWHGTRPISQGERLTVAFDISP